MKNIIIGKNSNLTNLLKKNISIYKIISARDENIDKLCKEIALNLNKNEKINLIFNNFFPSKKLNKLKDNDYKDFVNLSIISTIKVLNIFNNNIAKIIYTSSASVYGININNFDDLANRKFSSSFKFLNENLINNFCTRKKINFCILRIFNMYSGLNDDFSVIGKIFNNLKNKTKITIDNNGESLRDFIHIKDVVNIIKILLKFKNKNKIYDLGTGYGIKIKDILNYVKFPKNLIIFKRNKDKIGNSIGNNLSLVNEINYKKFINLEDFIKKNYDKKLYGHLNKYKYKKIINTKRNNYIIYGAGNVGRQVHDQLSQSKENILFFIDDKKKIQGKLYNGTKIISFNDLKKLSFENELGSIIISISNLDELKLEKIKNKLRKFSSNIIYIPTKKKLISDKISLNDAMSLGIEDVIGRKEIDHNKKNNSIRNKNILVTGAGGSIGSELCRQIESLKAKKIVALDNSEIALFNLKKFGLKKTKLVLNDINNNLLINQILKKEKIHHIFHAAAYKHVNILEKNIEAAINNNIFGTLSVIENAAKNGTNFTLISTDKAASPISILGISKRFSEIITSYYRKTNPKIKINIVRFGNVFGSVGSAVPTFIDQINNNKTITITNKKATRYFMTIKEACTLVLETINLNQKNKTFILNMGKQIKIIDIINYLIKIKKINNPNYVYKIKEIGLRKGEKIKEELTSKKEKIKKINKNIFAIKEVSYQNEIVENKLKKIYSLKRRGLYNNIFKIIKNVMKKENIT